MPSRIVSAFLVIAALACTSSAYAGPFGSAPPSARAMTSSSSQSSNRSASPSNVVRHGNGTTITYSGGARVIQPYGRHAQPMVQHRDAKGTWTKATMSKTWGVRTWASSRK